MVISDSQRKRLESLMNAKEEIKQTQKDLKDGIKNLADEMDVKPAVLTKIISLVEKERAKGGIIADEKSILEIAESL